MSAPVPAPYRWLALSALLLAAVGFGYVKGATAEQQAQAAHRVDQLTATVRVIEKQVVITEQVNAQLAASKDRERVIVKTIIKEVPIYVPSSTPDLPAGFRLLHDAAALGAVPDRRDGADAAAVSAQDAAATVAENYSGCRDNAAQVIAWQQWYEAQREQARLCLIQPPE